MKRTFDMRNNFGTIWRAETYNFYISLNFDQSFDKYDGDDPDGEFQAMIDRGEMVMFDSEITVEYDGETIGRATLGNSVYRDGETFKFVTDSGYFRDMLAEACNEARIHLSRYPRVRSPK